jgi:hypothetical protein
MIGTPVLVITFNRPDKLEKLINSLRITNHQILRFSIDGARKGNNRDKLLIQKTIEVIKSVDWTEDIEIFQNEENLKPRYAVPKAVSRIFEDFDRVIVLEDDIEISSKTIKFFELNLKNYKNNSSIMHISGYNNVPKYIFNDSSTSHRKTIFPESYAWATWKEKWLKYDDNTDNVELSVYFDKERDYFKHIGFFGKACWKLEKKISERNYISTWVYRWMFSIWAEKAYCISPNINLIKYDGLISGTHTKTKQRWSELEIERDENIEIIHTANFDWKAEKWSSKNVYRDNLKDFLKLVGIYVIFKLKYRYDVFSITLKNLI